MCNLGILCKIFCNWISKEPRKKKKKGYVKGFLYPNCTTCWLLCKLCVLIIKWSYRYGLFHLFLFLFHLFVCFILVKQVKREINDELKESIVPYILDSNMNVKPMNIRWGRSIKWKFVRLTLTHVRSHNYIVEGPNHEKKNLTIKK